LDFYVDLLRLAADEYVLAHIASSDEYFAKL
jgi:hypothetical protein